MLIRIVKLHLKDHKINDFLIHFETIKWKVTNFPGCNGMKLLQDKENLNIIITYSSWQDENALDNYKKSELFNAIWPTIKIWFKEKPEAWSLIQNFDGFKGK
jgi:quinol monooxygenase YgiN